MNYKNKTVKLKDTLAFWEHFSNEERVFFYNPLEDELVIGAKRHKSFFKDKLSNLDNSDLKDFLYLFYSQTFFSTIKDPKWDGFGNEIIAFEYYLVVKEGKMTLYYLDNTVEIEDRIIPEVAHNYQICANDYDDWEKLFTHVHNEIIHHRAEKVVISREITVECDTLIHVASVIKKLWKNNRGSFIFAYAKDGKTFLGATPEILVEKKKDNVITYALAGTISRNEGDVDRLKEQMLMNDEKNRIEHQIVIDYIVAVMKRFIPHIVVGETKVLTLKNLYHLKTKIMGRDQYSSLLDWVERLHPTPALGGNPVEKALDIIQKHEKHERGLYASPIGMIKQNGDGVFVAGIRSALIQGKAAYVYAGCGIVEKSECEKEYLETNNKAKTIIESL